MTGRDDLNDDLSDLLGGTMPTERAMPMTPAAVAHREQVAKDPGFFQKCSRCNGTGQTRWGTCFKCRGAKGKTFKTSPEQRATNRTRATLRRQTRQEEQALAAEQAFDAWRVANPQAWAVLDKAAKRGNAFSASLLENVRKFGGLTKGQSDAVQRMIDREAQWAADRAQAVADAPAVDVTHIVTAFTTAREKAARPGQRGVWVKPLRMRSGTKEQGTDLSFSVGRPGGQWEGVVFAETVDTGKKLGMIKDGKFVRKFACTDAEAAAVLDCASEPEKATAVFGKAWSICSICSRTLLNDGSIERGIGPICAEKFGW